MLYNFLADDFHTKKLCSRLSSSEVRFHTENSRFAFLIPLGGLRATYNDHLRLIGKRVVDFLLVLIILFAGCYGWGATSEYRQKIGVFAPTGSAWPKISGRRFYLLHNHSSCHKTTINDLKWSFLLCKNVGKTFFRFVANHAFDRRMDRRTDGQTDEQADRFLVARPRCMQCMQSV